MQSSRENRSIYILLVVFRNTRGPGELSFPYLHGPHTHAASHVVLCLPDPHYLFHWQIRFKIKLELFAIAKKIVCIWPPETKRSIQGYCIWEDPGLWIYIATHKLNEEVYSYLIRSKYRDGVELLSVNAAFFLWGFKILQSRLSKRLKSSVRG